RSIAGAANNAKRSLADCRDHDVIIKDLRDSLLMAKTLEAGNREDDSVVFAAGHFPQSCINISTKRKEIQGRESMPQLHLPSETARSDSRSRAQVLKPGAV